MFFKTVILSTYLTTFCIALVATQAVPKFPNSFSTRVQLYLFEYKTITEFKLIYDSQRNVGVFEDSASAKIYNYTRGDILNINGVQCESTVAEDAPKDEELTAAGAKKVNGQYNIYSPQEIFSFNDVIFDGTEKIDNVETEKWTSNKILQFEEISINCSMTYWIITNQTNCLNPDTPCLSYPAKMEMQCNMDNNKLDHIMRFFEFSTEVPQDEIFQQPLGVFCFGKQAESLPQPPTRFNWFAEMIVPDQMGHGTTSQLEYRYDREYGIMRIVQMSNDLSVNTASYFETHLGLTYTLDLILHTCTISYDPKEVGVFADRNEVLWRFGKDITKHQFVGERTIGGITYVVYASTNAEPGISDFQVRNFYYREGTYQFNATLLIPAFQEIYEYKGFKVYRLSTERIFRYIPQPPEWYDIDVTDCFRIEDDTKVVQFQLNIKAENLTEPMVANFREQCQQSLLGVLGISLMRLNQLEFFQLENEVISVVGSITENLSKLGIIGKNREPDMNAAFANLENVVKQNNFALTVHHSGKEYDYMGISVERFAGGTDVKGQCQPAPTITKAEDAFPDIFQITVLSYQMTVEANMAETKTTLYAAEFYDKELARGRVDTLYAGKEKRFLYFNETDEAFTTATDEYTCDSVSIKGAKAPHEDYGVYGWTNKDPKQPIIGPANLLRDGFTAFQDKKMGKERDSATVRGIRTDVWKLCADGGNTEIRYFFIDNSTESGFNVKNQPVPARITVKNDKVNHVYDFVNFKTFAADQEAVFAIPVTKGCKRLTEDLKFLPNYDGADFHVEAEVVYTPIKGPDSHSYVSNLGVTIDARSGHLAYTLTPWKAHSDAEFAEPGDFEEQVFDFKNGILYDLDRATEQCNITDISKGKSSGPVITFPDGQVLQLLDENLFVTDNNTVNTYHYLGDGVERGIPVSIFERKFGSAEEMKETIVTRYHLADDTFLNSEHSEQHAPIKVIYWNLYGDTEKQFTGVVVFNFYSFSSRFGAKPKKFDVTPCFSDNDQSKWFQITFPMNENEARDVIPVIPEIQDNILDVLKTKVLKISPLRIPKVIVDVDSDNIYVTALVLERPDFMFDFQDGGPYAITTKDATDRGLTTKSGCAKICLKDPKCKFFSQCGAVCKTETTDPFAGTGGVKSDARCNYYFQTQDKADSSLPTMDQITAFIGYEVESGSIELEFGIRPGGGALKIVTFTAKDFKDGIAYGLEGLTYRPEDQIEDRFSIFKSGYKFDEVTSDISKPFGIQSFATCRRLCLNSAYCESISFCMANSQCSISSAHTEEIKEEHIKEDSQCIILSRAYLDYFEHYPGFTLTKKAMKALDSESSENCAMLCEKETGFTCLSFDFCFQSGSKQCLLHADHFLDQKEPEQITTEQMCGHYSRKRVYDFDNKPGQELTGSVGMANEALNVEQCAKYCLESPTVCTAFDYCQTPTKASCRMTSEPAPHKTNSKPTCNVYERSQKERVRREVQSAPEGFSKSTVGGVSFFLFLVGAGIGVGGMFGYGYYRANKS